MVPKFGKSAAASSIDELDRLGRKQCAANTHAWLLSGVGWEVGLANQTYMTWGMGRNNLKEDADPPLTCPLPAKE